MAKFLDKKERVLDLELTSYGKYLFSVGKFKPVYYAFYDDNIIYDGAYANITESQNNVHVRVKEETPYLGSLVLFEGIDNKLQKIPRVDETGKGIISIDTVALEPEKPRFDNFRYDNAIGDSLLDGRDNSLAPAWKVLTLRGLIESSSQKETSTSITELNIPQVNIKLNYKKIITERDIIPSNPNADLSNFESLVFEDNRVIQLKMDDPMIYIDEVNTQILNENFDVEVFLLEDGDQKQSLTRKFFENKKEQIVNGIMMSDQPEVNFLNEQMTKNAVEYYFDIKKDADVDQSIACKSIELYNKQTYYVNLDFDCEFSDIENFYNDIYGSEVVPEICRD
ncbi:MAG: hypothetical protein CML45_00605 [Rhodobacteraceae bacterium]|nr:hypothetical protein [Paracoccaceae bacterium]|tara:strand:+ start:16079 stop:17092 length:1014 start_codon:yes stop_codon:yes gene_type:complete